MPASNSSSPSRTPDSQSDDGAAFHSISAFAVRWGVCERSIRRLIESGKLTAYRIGGQIRVSEDDARSFLQSNVVPKATIKQKRQ